MIESMEMAELYRYKEGDEERIIGLLEEHGEDGISAFALCTQLGIKFQPLNVMLERLQRNGQARMVRRKSGAIYWYPDDNPPAAPIEPEPESKAPKQEITASPKRVPCPVRGCRSTVARRNKSAYMHLYSVHNLRGDALHAHLDTILGADRQRPEKKSGDDHRTCPMPGCPSEFRGKHARASLINHLVLRHDLGREDARNIADGKPSSLPRIPPRELGDDLVDADIIPPSEVECEGYSDQLHDGECAQGEECVCNSVTKMEQLQADAEIPDCDGDTCRIGPLPVREDLPLPRPAPGPCEPLNTCTPLEVRHVTIPTTERPQDEPTPLARICALAVEMEALAARHGYSVQVDIDTYVGAAPQIQLRARRMGAIE